MQLTAIWHWYLPLCICSKIFFLFLSIPFLYFSLIWYWSIRWNVGWCQHVPALHALLTGVILKGLTLQRFACIFIIHLLAPEENSFCWRCFCRCCFIVFLCFIKLVSTFPYICSVVFHQIGEYISLHLFYLYVLCLCKGWFLWLTWEKVYVWEEVWSVHLLMAQFNILRWPCAVDKTLKFSYLPTN